MSPTANVLRWMNSRRASPPSNTNRSKSGALGLRCIVCSTMAWWISASTPPPAIASTIRIKERCVSPPFVFTRGFRKIICWFVVSFDCLFATVTATSRAPTISSMSFRPLPRPTKPTLFVLANAASRRKISLKKLVATASKVFASSTCAAAVASLPANNFRPRRGRRIMLKINELRDKMSCPLPGANLLFWAPRAVPRTRSTNMSRCPFGPNTSRVMLPTSCTFRVPMVRSIAWSGTVRYRYISLPQVVSSVEAPSFMNGIRSAYFSVIRAMSLLM